MSNLLYVSRGMKQYHEKVIPLLHRMMAERGKPESHPETVVVWDYVEDASHVELTADIVDQYGVQLTLHIEWHPQKLPWVPYYTSLTPTHEELSHEKQHPDFI